MNPSLCPDDVFERAPDTAPYAAAEDQENEGLIDRFQDQVEERVEGRAVEEVTETVYDAGDFDGADFIADYVQRLLRRECASSSEAAIHTQMV